MFADPSGEGFLLMLLLGLIIGAVIAGVKSDNKIGSKAWWRDVGKGALIGAAVGGALNVLGGLAFAGSMGGMALAGGGIAGAGAIGISEIAILGIGMTYIFMGKGKPGNNKVQNDQYSEAMRRLKIKKGDWRWRFGHDNLPRPHDMNFKELLEFLKNLFS